MKNNFDFYTNPYYTKGKNVGYLVQAGDTVEVIFGQAKKVIEGEVLEVFTKDLLVETQFGKMKFHHKKVRGVVVGKERKPDLNAKQLQKVIKELHRGRVPDIQEICKEEEEINLNT